MEKKPQAVDNALIYYRLIALWVVCEAVLGGIIHGFRLPVSGFVVGSSAVVCICLIAYHVPQAGAIIRATLIVAIFKMMLSPHSPLPAYFALFFQGLLGELLFFRRLHYRLSCLLLGAIALLESGVQRIFVVTLLYGKGLWTAVNDFIEGFTRQSVDYSYWLIFFYLGAHLAAGLAGGWFAASLPRRLAAWKDEALLPEGALPVPVHTERRRGPRAWLLAVWVLLLLLWAQASWGPGRPLLPARAVVHLLLRAVLVLLTWYCVLSPLLTRLLKSWLQKEATRSGAVIAKVLALLPSTRFLVARSWQHAASAKGLRRLGRFGKIVLTNTLRHA